MVDIFPPPFIFVIDTKKKADDFAYDLVNYVTGQATADESDDEYEERKEAFEIDFPKQHQYFWDHMLTLSEYNRDTNFSTWETPGVLLSRYNDILDPTWDDDLVREKIKSSEKKYWEMSIANHKLWASPEIHQKYLEWAESRKNLPPERYPALHSVAIFFAETPPDSILEFMKKRAAEFLGETNIELQGFRGFECALIQQEVPV